MPMKFAILLDAGFLKRKLASSDNPMVADQVVEFTNKLIERDELKGCQLHRIYYYYAPPMEGKMRKPLTGGSNKSLYDFSTSPVYRSNKP